ncbi:ATP-binding protein [Paraclostridium ghonii]|uniref:sensor histidine kinase n=1 Tax=Paraclostridium ghonii TaxID=29358 RepID=UPI0035266114
MLDYYYVLARINICIFIFFFFMLMNKRGYVYNIKTNMEFILILILFIALIKNGMPFGVVVLELLIIIISILSLMCKITYKIDMKESIINSIMYSLFYILIECSIYWILQSSFKYEAIHMIILNIAINFIIIFICIYFFDRLQKIYNHKKYYIYIILTITVNIFIILFLNISYEKIGDLYSILVKNNMEYSNVLGALVISGFMKNTFPYIIFIINIILISIFINSIKVEKQKVKAEFVNEKLDMQYKYYLMVKESQEKMRQIYHDMNNHMKNIKSLKNSSEDVDKYINNIEDEVKSSKNIYNTGSVLLDIILYEKSKDCMENNIDFNIGIDFSKCEFIQMIDISSIFSNLIDNSIEACNKINDKELKRYINIKSTFIKGYYVIRCENSKINKIIVKNNKIFTTKKDKFFHGLGLESIKSSIKKYDGELKLKNEKYKFIVSIHIPIE